MMRMPDAHPGLWAARLCAASAVILLMLACSGRERSNPFDPLNPDTHGVPAVAGALAGCHRVDLSWHDFGMQDLQGFRIWRMAAGEPAAPGSLLTAEVLAPLTSTFADTTALNGVSYTYHLEFCFEGGGAQTLAAPVEARPGAARPWSADPCGWGMSLLSPDAGAVLETVAFGGAVFDLDVDQSSQRVFAAQIDADLVLVYRSSGEQLDALSVAGPSCISWSPVAQALAVGAFYEGRAEWLTVAGGSFFSLDLGDAHPEDIAFRDSVTTWIALNEGLLLRVDLSAGEPDTIDVDVERPVAIADDPGRGCWIADRSGSVVYVRDDGTSVAAPAGTFAEPLDVGADDAGCCWVADWAARALVLLDRECNVVATRDEVGPVAGVTYDPVAEALWVALPERGEVLFISLVDGWERRVVVGGCPRKIEGDWSGGCDSE
jgi:hypothetical protein